MYFYLDDLLVVLNIVNEVIVIAGGPPNQHVGLSEPIALDKTLQL